MRNLFASTVAIPLATFAFGCSSADATDAATTSAASTTGAGGATTSSSTGAGASSSSSTGGGDMPTKLPTAKGPCAAMSNLSGADVMFAGQAATVWSGDPAKGPGPLLIYYYATGSDSMEPYFTMGKAQVDKITSLGGAVVAQVKTNGQGNTTGNNVWYKGDADIADEIVACAIENQKIDPRHVHVAGYSAGAIQTTFMWFARSGYVASVLTYSGGDDLLNNVPQEDTAHPPAALVTHGAMGKDTYGGVIDFAQASAKWEGEIKMAGGFAIDCDDGGTHTDFMQRTKIAPQALQFFLDHPYAVNPEPYTTLPAGFPPYCTIK